MALTAVLALAGLAVLVSTAPATPLAAGVADASYTLVGKSPKGSTTSSAGIRACRPPVHRAMHSRMHAVRAKLVSFARTDTTPTNAVSVSWTLVFSKAMRAPAAADFTLVARGLSGKPSITSIRGSRKRWTVTASTGTDTPSGSGSLRLNIAARLTDLACNPLKMSIPHRGPVYTIDKTPPGIVFTQTPPDPSPVATSTFAWQLTPTATDFDHYECRLESGPFSTSVVVSDGAPAQRCSSPLTFAVGNVSDGSHQFSVRAYDRVGNYTQISYGWTVAAQGVVQHFTGKGSTVSQGSPQAFTIDGDQVGILQPGGPPRQIAVTLHNPNSVVIYVTSVTVTLRTADFAAAGCSSAAFHVTQATIPASGVLVPANGQLTLPAQGATAATVVMDDAGNQNLCQNLTFHFDYSGSAHS